MAYIGQTKRQIKTRFEEHANQKPSSVDHLFNPGRMISIDDFKLIRTRAQNSLKNLVVIFFFFFFFLVTNKKCTVSVTNSKIKDQ